MWDYVTVNSGQDYLSHHGILGMKWGIRRYQNDDGTLTAVGKKRYGNAETEFSELNAARKEYEQSKDYYMKKTAAGLLYNRKATDRLNKSVKRLANAKTDLNDAKDRVSLQNQKKKGKRQIKLEESYRDKGLTKEEAELAAYKRIRTEKTIAIVAGMTVVAAAAYVGYKHYDNTVDRLIKSGTVLQNMSNNANRGVSDAFYASFGKHDNNRYLGFYGSQLQKSVNYGFSSGVYKTNIKLGDDLRLASPKNAVNVLRRTMQKDSQFADGVRQSLKGLSQASLSPNQKKVFDKALKSLNAGKIDNHVYEAVNIALVDHTPRGQSVSSKFYDALKKAGYDAIKDINDSKYSGYNTRNPIIVFNGSAKTAVDSISSMGKQQIEKQLKAEIYKKYAEDLVKAYAPSVQLPIGVGSASKLAIDALTEKANLEYVKKYRKEHPKSELSAKEIIRTRHK